MFSFLIIEKRGPFIRLSCWLQKVLAGDIFVIFFLFFFPENSFWRFMQIVSLALGDNLRETPKPIF